MAKGMRTHNIVTPTADNLAATARKASKKGLPPVHLWNPPFCGDLDMRIARDGSWYYLGSPIRREGLVRLFSSILKKEDNQYFLVTPAEKVGITVDDAPFVAVDFTVRNPGVDQELTFRTHIGDEVTACAEKPIRVELDPKTDEPSPYIMIRADLEALIDRKTFFRLVSIGETNRYDGADWFGVRSKGVFFPIAPAEDLDLG